MGSYLQSPLSNVPIVLKPSDLKADPKRLLSLYQVLSPKLLSRGRSFGNKLRIKPEWTQVDGGYFDAPGSFGFPLGSADKSKSNVCEPFVATVFLQVDGGKAYATKYRSDAVELHLTLLALIKSTLRLIPGGYLAKAQDGELKYLLSFTTTEAAVYWAAQLQLASLFASWPQSALKHWPEEKGIGEQVGALLFCGPRIKIGIAEGHLRSITPDWTGRADCHGPSVNQAARFMDAAAWGGQIALEEGVAMRAMEAMVEISHKLSDKGADEIVGESQSSQFQEVPPEMVQEASLIHMTSPPSFNLTSMPSFSCSNNHHSHLSKPALLDLQRTPSAVTISIGSNGHPKPIWEPPNASHLLPLDLFTLVAQRLGRFSFKGSDEVLSMVNITPASLLSRQFPPDAPKGKGERVSGPNNLDPNEGEPSIKIPSMKFIQEMREQYLSNLAQAVLMNRTEGLTAGGTRRERFRKTSVSRMGPEPNFLMRVTEEGEGREGSEGHDSQSRNSARPSMFNWGRSSKS